MNKPCETCETKCKTFEQIDACAKIKKYNDALEKSRKYKKGNERIDSIDKLLATEWIWWYGKPKHRSIFISMPLRTVMHFIQSKSLFVAELKEKTIDQQDKL
jgi:hypothetical protein